MENTLRILFHFYHTFGIHGGAMGGAFAAPMELFVAKKHDFLGGESV